MGGKGGGVLLKCMRSVSWKTFRCHTVSRGAARMQMPARLSLNHWRAPSERTEYISTVSLNIYDECERSCAIDSHWLCAYTHTQMDTGVCVWVCAQRYSRQLIWGVTVTRAEIERMLAHTARKTK